MNWIISWIGYIWLLTIDTWEQLIETARERFLNPGSLAEDSRNLHLGEKFWVSPPTAVR